MISEVFSLAALAGQMCGFGKVPVEDYSRLLIGPWPTSTILDAVKAQTRLLYAFCRFGYHLEVGYLADPRSRSFDLARSAFTTAIERLQGLHGMALYRDLFSGSPDLTKPFAMRKAQAHLDALVGAYRAATLLVSVWSADHLAAVLRVHLLSANPSGIWVDATWPEAAFAHVRGAGLGDGLLGQEAE